MLSIFIENIITGHEILLCSQLPDFPMFGPLSCPQWTGPQSFTCAHSLPVYSFTILCLTPKQSGFFGLLLNFVQLAAKYLTSSASCFFPPQRYASKIYPRWYKLTCLQCCTNAGLWLFHSLSIQFCIFGWSGIDICMFVYFCDSQPVCHMHSYACLVINLCQRLGYAVCQLFKIMPSCFTKWPGQFQFPQVVHKGPQCTES